MNTEKFITDLSKTILKEGKDTFLKGAFMTALRGQGLAYSQEKEDIIYETNHLVKGSCHLCTADVVTIDGSILYIKGRHYVSDMDSCITDEQGNKSHFWSFDYHEHFRPWKLEDVKDGDFLVWNDCRHKYIFIFQGFEDCHMNAYITLNAYKGTIEEGAQKNRYYNTSNIRAATEEEKQYLLERMSQEGFTWDSEKKELTRKQLFRDGEWYVCRKTTPHFTEGEPYLLKRQNDRTLVFDNIYGNTTYVFLNDITGDKHIFEPWNPRDAKDGDVISVGLGNEGVWTGIYKEGKDMDSFSTHCHIDTDGIFHEGQEDHEGRQKIKPATSDEWTLLNEAMRKAGFAWNCEEKQLSGNEPHDGFKAGDWVTCVRQPEYASSAFTVGKPYKLRSENSLMADKWPVALLKEEIERCFKPWSIEDVKDGDILVWSDKTTAYIFPAKMHNKRVAFTNHYLDMRDMKIVKLYHDRAMLPTSNITPATEDEVALLRKAADMDGLVTKGKDIIFSKFKKSFMEAVTDAKFRDKYGYPDIDRQVEKLLDAAREILGSSQDNN